MQQTTEQSPGGDTARYCETLVSQLLLLESQAAPLNDQIKALKDELKELMIGGDPIFNAEGIGYRKDCSYKLEYTPEAVSKLEEMGLLKHFAAISTSKIADLKKQGLLSALDIAVLEDMSEEKEVITLRKTYKEEAKVFA